MDRKPEREARGIRRLALLVEYEGARYHGFQAQRNAISIQEQLETALHRFTGERRRIKGASRTDAGAHAKGQVVVFDTMAAYPPGVFVQALNHYLPEDISVKEAREVPGDFRPRRWAVSREYQYHILNSSAPSPLLRGYTYLVRKPLDVTAMQEGARLLEGTRDCAPFSGPLPHPRVGTGRTVYRCSVAKPREVITLTMVADGFLPQQVRRTAGALVEVGLGRLNLHQFDILANCGVLGAASKVLPSRGLFLMKVNYATPLFFKNEVKYALGQVAVEAGVM